MHDKRAYRTGEITPEVPEVRVEKVDLQKILQWTYGRVTGELIACSETAVLKRKIAL